MKEQVSLLGGLLGRQSNKPKDTRSRLIECQQGVKRLRNKNNILQKQCQNQLQLQGQIKTAIQQNCQYLEVQTEKILDLLQRISLDFLDSVIISRMREILKKIKRQILRSKDILTQMVKKASTPSAFNTQKSTSETGRQISRSEQVGQHKPKPRNRSTNQYYKDNRLSGNIPRASLLKNGQTKQKKIQSIIDECHNRVLRNYYTLNDRIGQEKAEVNGLAENQKKVRMARKVRMVNNIKKASRKCYIITIIVIVVLLLGSGIAIYMLFFE